MAKIYTEEQYREYLTQEGVPDAQIEQLVKMVGKRKITDEYMTDPRPVNIIKEFEEAALIDPLESHDKCVKKLSEGHAAIMASFNDQDPDDVRRMKELQQSHDELMVELSAIRAELVTDVPKL